jgi:hypothetical protein
VSFLERLQEATKAHEATLAQCYAEADGNERKAKRSLRRKLFAEYRNGKPTFKFIDPATLALIFALMQLAFKAWKWAKDNGYLTAYAYQLVPMQTMLVQGYHAGEFKEAVEAPLLLEMFDDDDE